MKLNEVMLGISIERNNMVIIEKRIHLFPYRTQKLSSSSLMVLRPKGLGRVGRSQLYSKVAQRRSTRLLTGRLWVRVPPLEPECGSIAQLGEHLPYKQGVTGSSPVGSTKFNMRSGSSDG